MLILPLLRFIDVIEIEVVDLKSRPVGFHELQ